MILRANHVISKRQSSYLCLGAWFWTVWTIELAASTSELLSATSYPFLIPWRKSLTVLLGKLTHVWNRLQSGQWLGTQRTWDEWSAVCGFLWTSGQSDWNPDVVQRSFRGRLGAEKNWLNNDPWIRSNYTICKSDPCLNSPERVGSSVFLVDMHFCLLPWVQCLSTCIGGTARGRASGA